MRNFMWEEVHEGVSPIWSSGRWLLSLWSWGSRNWELNSHLVNWLKVAPLSSGGLGTGNFRRNAALLAKWRWRYTQKEPAMWKTTVRIKDGQTDNSWLLDD